MDAVCEVTADCTISPANRSIGMATPMPLNVVTEVSICEDQSWFYWKVHGPFAAGQAFALGATVHATGFGFAALQFGTVAGGMFVGSGNTLNVHANGSPAGWTTLVVNEAADDIVIGIHTNMGANFQTETVLLMVQPFTNTQSICATPPTNTTRANATAITAGQVVTAEVCSLPSDTEFYWTLPGPFAPGDIVQLDYLSGRALVDDLNQSNAVLYLEQADGLGSFVLLLTASEFGILPMRQQAVLPSASPILHLRTDMNPSVLTHRQLSFKVETVTQ
jgi:hypothetical protein